MSEENDISWKKPAWAQGGVKLRSTGKADKMKTDGNLAADITSLPHQKDDGPFRKPEWTGEASSKEGRRVEGSLEKPITALAHGADKSLGFAKPDWTQNTKLRGTGKLDALKQGKEIARPIGGIKPVEAD